MSNQESHGGERLLDVTAAAAMLGVRRSTMYQWAYQRRIPVVKLLGKSLRSRLSAIQRLMKDGERPALDSRPAKN